MPIEIHTALRPASSEAFLVEDLLLAGTEVFRLNLSHGQAEHLPNLVKLIRNVSPELENPVQIAPLFAVGRYDWAHLISTSYHCQQGKTTSYKARLKVRNYQATNTLLASTPLCSLSE